MSFVQKVYGMVDTIAELTKERKMGVPWRGTWCVVRWCLGIENVLRCGGVFGAKQENNNWITLTKFVCSHLKSLSNFKSRLVENESGFIIECILKIVLRGRWYLLNRALNNVTGERCGMISSFWAKYARPKIREYTMMVTLLKYIQRFVISSHRARKCKSALVHMVLSVIRSFSYSMFHAVPQGILSVEHNIHWNT